MNFNMFKSTSSLLLQILAPLSGNNSDDDDDEMVIHTLKMIYKTMSLKSPVIRTLRNE